MSNISLKLYKTGKSVGNVDGADDVGNGDAANGEVAGDFGNGNIGEAGNGDGIGDVDGTGDVGGAGSGDVAGDVDGAGITERCSRLQCAPSAPFDLNDILQRLQYALQPLACRASMGCSSNPAPQYPQWNGLILSVAF